MCSKFLLSFADSGNLEVLGHGLIAHHILTNGPRGGNPCKEVRKSLPCDKPGASGLSPSEHRKITLQPCHSWALQIYPEAAEFRRRRILSDYMMQDVRNPLPPKEP